VFWVDEVRAKAGVYSMINRIKLAYVMSRRVLRGQEGSILTGIILAILTIVILGFMLPAFWPMLTESTANISAINGTDTATVFLKTGWPIAILIVGIGIVVALIYFALRQFGVIGGRK